MGFITNNHMDMSEKLGKGPSYDNFYTLNLFTNENVDSPVFCRMQIHSFAMEDQHCNR
jgi:hypothetical protein